MSLFAGDMIIYREDPKESIKPVELISEVSKVTVYKVSLQRKTIAGIAFWKMKFKKIYIYKGITN